MFTYDYHKNQYWEIKKHILPEFRAKSRIPSPNSIANSSFFDNDTVIEHEEIVNPTPFKIFETHFTKKDKDDLVKEYEELEMEMLQIFNANTTVNNNLQSYKLYTLF